MYAPFAQNSYMFSGGDLGKFSRHRSFPGLSVAPSESYTPFAVSGYHNLEP